MPTIEQLRNAAAGKNAQHNGMNMPEIEAYLKDQGVPIDRKDQRPDLEKRLKEHLGMPDPRSAFRVPRSRSRSRSISPGPLTV